MKKFDELNDLIDHYKQGNCKLVFQSLTTIILDYGSELIKIDFVGSVDGYLVTSLKTYIINSSDEIND